MRRRDDLAVHNERVKLGATTSSAVGLGFFGLGFVRPLIDDPASLTLLSVVYAMVGVMGIGGAYIALGYLETDRNGENKEKGK